MKQYYNQESFKLILKIMRNMKNFNDIDLINKETNNRSLKENCCSLSYYNINDSTEKGMKMNQRELDLKEQEGEIFNSYLLKIIARCLLLKGRVNNEDTNNLRIILEKLHYCLGNGYYFKTEEDIIKKLLIYGKNSTISKNEFIGDDKYIEQIAKSALYLKSKGIHICVGDEGIKCSEEIVKKIFDLLDEKIKIVGGVPFYIEIMKRFVNNTYCAIMDRYLLTRKVDNERNEPINLLLQLSGRHLQDRGVDSEEKRKELIDEIILIAESFLDIIVIQGESVFEYVNMDFRMLPYYLKNEMYFDKICIPMQYSKQFILKSMDYLIKPWFDRANRKYCYKDYRKVAEYILSINCLKYNINSQQVKNETKIELYKIDQILEDISNPIADINKEYISFDKKTNLFSRPLIKISLNGYYMIDQHFSGIGFYFAAYDLIKKNYSKLDREQGLELEKMLHDEMKQKGYNFLTGKYNDMNGIVGSDCDLVLDKEYLYFLEVKKKSVMEEFDAVDDVSLFNSLAAGMIKAQVQSFSHELYLRKNKNLNLYNGNTYIIKLDKKKLPARKISICFSEYSFLTSKLFSNKLLVSLLICNYNSVDKKKDLKVLKKCADKLRKTIAELKKEVESLNRIEFFSLFCSMQQILTAIWCTDNEEQFIKIINKWIYSQNKTLNPYIDIISF